MQSLDSLDATLASSLPGMASMSSKGGGDD